MYVAQVALIYSVLRACGDACAVVGVNWNFPRPSLGLDKQSIKIVQCILALPMTDFCFHDIDPKHAAESA